MTTHKFSHGVRGPHVLGFVQREGNAGRELDGLPGLHGATLTYCVFPCLGFDDLETHAQVAETSDPSVNEKLSKLVSAVRQAYEGGRLKTARAALCGIVSGAAFPGADEMAPISRQWFRGCALSTGIALGLLLSDEACGTADNCPAVPNPMQDDLDGDGVGGACDNGPETANAERVDTDDRGDVCDLCPEIAEPRESGDRDEDGVGDTCDHCPSAPNPDGKDSDGDGRGEACDPE